MNTNLEKELAIDYEVRLRVQEELAKDIRDVMRHIDTKLDSQFKWTIGTIITLFGGIILHMAKLI